MNKLLLCLLLIITISCEKKINDTVINVNHNEKTSKHDYIVDIKKIVILESCKEAVIGSISKVEYYNNKYYILDRDNSKTLYMYDSNGKFLSKTIIGKGPGELIKIRNFIIDRKEKLIKVFDISNGAIFSFDENLKFKNKQNGVNYLIEQFYPIDSNYNIAFTANVSTDEDIYNPRTTHYNHIIYDKDYKKIVKKLFPIDKQYTNLALSNPISKCKEKIKFVNLFDNNIYSINNLKTNIEYLIDFGKHSLTQKDLKRGANYVWDLFYKGKRIIVIDDLYESENYISFFYSHRGRGYNCLYSKKNRNSYLTKFMFKKNEIPISLVKGIDLMENFIAVVEAKDLLKYSKIELAKEFNEMHNPALLIYNLIEK